jgi:hypothetical protein
VQQGVALKHDDRLTSLGRLYWNHQSTLTAADIERWRVLVGLAFRDSERDDLNWLARIERRHEDNPTALTPFVRDSWILGLNTNLRLGRGHTLTQHWAYKWSHEAFAPDLLNRTRIGLVFMRYTHNLTERIDLDVHGGVNQSVLIKIEHLRTQAVCHHRHRFAPYEAGSKYNFFKFRILRIQYFSHYIICVLW